MLEEKLIKLRKKQGYSQQEVADLLSVTRQTISNWENNNILPSIEMLVKIAAFFSVSTDYLLELDQRKCIEVSGLTDQELAHIQQIISDICKKI